MKQKTLAARQREFREQQLAEGCDRLGVWLRKGDCLCLLDGVVTDSVREMARKALQEFWPVAEAEETLRKGA